MHTSTANGPNILSVDDDANRRGVCEKLLTENGYGIAGSITIDDLTPGKVEERQADVVLINAPAPDARALSAIRKLQDAAPRPIVLFSEANKTERIKAVIAAGVSAYIEDGLGSNRLRSSIDLAIAQFGESQSLRLELEKTQTALSERKLIERAKGIVMKQRSLDEEGAFQVMRKTAMDKNVRVAELAKTLIDATEILG